MEIRKNEGLPVGSGEHDDELWENIQVRWSDLEGASNAGGMLQQGEMLCKRNPGLCTGALVLSEVPVD
jgi:hypothetical protein